MPDDADPALDWARHTLRVLKVIDNQVRALRKLQVIEGFKRGDRTGVYLGSAATSPTTTSRTPCRRPTS